jgi:hypothetical protein
VTAEQDNRIIVCRCEDLTLADIRRLVAAHHIRDLDTLKRIGRCGMGPCQGKNCRTLVLRELSRLSGIGPESLKPDRIRPPAKPLRLGALLETRRSETRKDG